MTDTMVSKFTRILPLSIRKEDGGAVHLKGDSPGGGHHSQAEQKERIRVTLSYPSKACGSMNPHKEIALRLTNDENPLFFYYLKITEADFPELRTQQGLLVDFHGFPNQLVTLLEKCDVNLNYTNLEDDCKSGSFSSGPRIVLVMKIGGNNNTVLDFVESNPFKYLCHLSLQINSGSDGEVKKYLCDVTTLLKKDYQLLSDKYGHLESESCRIKDQLEQKLCEISALRDKLHQQANSLSTKHFQDMTEEKEKLLRLQGELASKFDQDRNELERRHSLGISSLEERILTLEKENRTLTQLKYQQDTALQESSVKMKHCEEDLKLLQKEITLTKKQNEKLDQDYHDKQRVNGNLHNRVTLLETDLREKQGILQRQHDQISQLSEQKKNLEDHATAMVKEVERIKNVNKVVSGELIKANEIIKKLQDDIRSLNSKTKLQSQVTTEQERVITDRDQTIHQLQAEIETLKSTLSSNSSQFSKLTTTVQDNEIKIADLEKTIKSNENMISWLNKQLNEFQGLSNLSKFRQNLASGGNLNSLPSPASEFCPSSRQADDNVNGQRFAPLSDNVNVNACNTLPNGTPSWMHIYQSTSTPLADDLSSRLEKVAATSEMRMSYKDLKSRFADRYGTEESGERKEKDKENDESARSLKGKPTTMTIIKNTRPPLWASGRDGRVTLGFGSAATATRK